MTGFTTVVEDNTVSQL